MIYIRLYTHVADCCVQLFSFSRALFRLLFFPILFAFLHSIKKRARLHSKDTTKNVNVQKSKQLLDLSRTTRLIWFV